MGEQKSLIEPLYHRVYRCVYKVLRTNRTLKISRIVANKKDNVIRKFEGVTGEWLKDLEWHLQKILTYKHENTDRFLK